jgi:hypothetical protein
MRVRLKIGRKFYIIQCWKLYNSTILILPIMITIMIMIILIILNSYMLIPVNTS